MQEQTGKKVHVGLALVIGASITFLLVGLGSAITFYTYKNQTEKAITSTEEIFDAYSRQVEEKIQSLLDSVESFVSISSVLEDLGQNTEENFKLLLPYFHQSFLSIPWMESFYVGYENGAFSMVQALRDNAAIRSVYSAPEHAAYAVKNVTAESEEESSVHLQFYDSHLRLLTTREKDLDGYDPRTREWYRDATGHNKNVITAPYIFFTSKKIGLTVARSLKAGTGVVGADTVLSSIASLLQEQQLTPSTEIFLSHKDGNILFCPSENIISRLEQARKAKGAGKLFMQDLGDQVAATLYQELIVENIVGGKIITVNGEKWFAHARRLVLTEKNDIFVTIGAPIKELMTEARATRWRNLLIMLSAMVFAIGLGIRMSHRIAASLHELSIQAEGIRDFKLSTVFMARSRIREVDELAGTMTVMQSAINRFVEIGRALSAEKDMDKVLEMIVNEAQSITGADGGAIGLVSDDEKCFSYVFVHNEASGVHVGGSSGKTVPEKILSLAADSEQRQSLEYTVVNSGTLEAITDIAASPGAVCASICFLHETEAYKCQSLLMIPLLNRQNEVIGVLHLVNARNRQGEIIAFPEHKISYVQSLSSNAALALDNNRLIRAQKELFDSFVRLIAGAIDTKSPYTGGHCQRVPVIAGLLADAASASEVDPLKAFQLSEDERYELFVASWLHDCGKVTTPEYVVDKATKLETIYNRIHEVRTRFELLWRDAEIAYYQGLTRDSESADALRQERDRRHRQLEEDFSFLAECNVGGEFMAPEKVTRLNEIGQQQWERHFDDRIGISGDEISRMDMTDISLPVTETLLADKEQHIFPRLDGGNPYGDNPWNIVMPVPEYSYNQGELYNLSITKGTLTEEERYKINDHIVQTIDMLNKLPFPKEIRRVPDWAGNHHEKLDGTGYPRCLTAAQLSIPERIMAVADIFEALTAADRPYKSPKKLSACIKIMSFMRKDGHICPDLFELLLTSGIYKDYAEKYMKPEQIDEVDVASYLG